MQTNNLQQPNCNSEVENDKANNKGEQILFQKIEIKLKEHNLPFNESEVMAFQEILNKLMNNNILRGEKTQTIICVLEYLISQLSGNPELNKLSLNQILELNKVELNTAKKLWNNIIDCQILNQITKWQGQRPISVLSIIQ